MLNKAFLNGYQTIILILLFVILLFLIRSINYTGLSEGTIKATMLYTDMIELKTNFGSLQYINDSEHMNNVHSDNISGVYETENLHTFDYYINDHCVPFLRTLKKYQLNTKKLDNLIIRTNSNNTVYTVANIESEISIICEDNDFTFQF